MGTFKTVERENEFRNPSSQSFPHPDLQALTAPHIESFNTLFEPTGANPQSLLEAALDDIGSYVVFDGKSDANNGLGNKITCKWSVRLMQCSCGYWR